MRRKHTKNVFRTFQRRKSLIIAGYFIISAFLFLLSFLTAETNAWLSNLMMGIGASCLASVLYSFITSIPNRYRFLFEQCNAKRTIIQGRYEAIDNGCYMFYVCCDTKDYEGALRRIGYIREKCQSLCDELRNAQEYEKLFIDDASVEYYYKEYEAAQLEHCILAAEIEADEEPLNVNNSSIQEYLERMKVVVKRYKDNYNRLYSQQLREATEIERIKIHNRY